MITKFRVDNFKTLFANEVQLKPLNILHGPADSGKTNFLEALAFASAAAYGIVDACALAARGVRYGGSHDFMSSSRGKRMASQICLRVDCAEMAHEVRLASPEARATAPWGFKRERLIVNGEIALDETKTKNSRLFTSGNAAITRLTSDPFRDPFFGDLREFRRYALLDAVLRGDRVEERPRDPLGLTGGRLALAFGELARKRPEIAREIVWMVGGSQWQKIHAPRRAGYWSFPLIQQAQLRFTSSTMASGRNEVFSRNVGDGILQALAILTLSMHPGGSALLAIDNSDYGLDSSLTAVVLQAVINWIGSGDCGRQILLVVKDLPSIDIAKGNGKVQVIPFVRDESGQTKDWRTACHLPE